MIRSIAKCILWSFLLAGAIHASDQREVFHFKYFNTDIPQKSPILFRTYPVYQGNDIFRVHFIVEIQYDFIQFVYDGKEYRAAAEFELSLKNESGGGLQSRIFQTEFSEAEFRNTNRKNLYHFTADSLQAAPGRYEVVLKYRDMHGKQKQQLINFKINLPQVDRFYASPILYAYPGKAGYGVFDPQPSALRSHWDFNEELGILVNAWYAQPEGGAKVALELFDVKEKRVIFSRDTSLNGSNPLKHLHLALSKNLFNEQEYQIKITYFNSTDTVEHRFPLRIIWFTKPLSLWDIKTAYGPLEYLIEDDKEFGELSKGSREEKWRKLQSFWEEKDPTPGTPFNELQYEFYSRVDSANVKYSRKRVPGWSTDIGKIYILYGAPDEVVDNSLAPIREPFLRWTYYQEERKISFTFLALDGRKRYKLAEVEEHPL